MGLSLDDIDRELAARQNMGDSALSEVDAELTRRGVEPRGMLSNVAGAIPGMAQKVATAAMPEVAAAIQAAQTPQIADPIKSAMAVPYQGLRGITTAATSGLQRGAEATQADFKPEGVKEHVAEIVAGLGDPRNLAMNPIAGEIFGGAKTLAAPAGKFLGEQAAKGVQVMQGVPAEDVAMTFKRPLDVLLSKSSKKAGGIFQKAKEAAGVTIPEERVTAGVSDPSSWKAIADKFYKKYSKSGAESLTTGEALAWKKAASNLARTKAGSAEHFYKSDAEIAQKILKSKAPEVARTQADVSLSKAREKFMSVFPRNKGNTPAVIRTLAAGGASAVNPLLAAAFSPLTGLAATVGTGATLKGINALGENPATRQILLAILSKLKGENQSQEAP